MRMKSFNVSMTVTGRITKRVTAKNAIQARIKAKRMYEEMPLNPDDFQIIDHLSYGDVDDYTITDSDHPEA